MYRRPSDVFRRYWGDCDELSDVPLVFPATLQNLERTIEDEECAQALASYHEAELFEPIHCHVCIDQPVCIDEGSLKKCNCGGVLQRQGSCEVSTILPQKFVKIRHYTLWRLKLLTEWRRENQWTSTWRRSVEPSASCHVAKVYTKVLNTSTGNCTPCRIKFLNQSNVKLCTLKRKEEQTASGSKKDYYLYLQSRRWAQIWFIDSWRGNI